MKRPGAIEPLICADERRWRGLKTAGERCHLPGVWLFFLVLTAGDSAWAQPPAPVTNAPLPAALGALTQPARKLPFKQVILATTGHRVLDLDTNIPAHATLVRQIQQAAAAAMERARREGIAAPRANEAGNHMEPLVREALKRAGLDARVPVNVRGRAQSAGYPDLEITDPVPCCLELKTYSAATATTTQRTFYYSPGENTKITQDALHLLLAFELAREARGGLVTFVPVRWKLITLQDLEVDLKFEFNQNNRGLYGNPRALLGDGGVSPSGNAAGQELRSPVPHR